MKSTLRTFLLFSLGAALLPAASLKPATLAGWNAYIEAAAQPSDGPFLWASRDPGRVQRLLQGEIVAQELKPEGRAEVPHALVHDWIAAVYIPGASLPNVLSILRDYDHYSNYFGPTITQSQLICSDQAGDHFSVRYTRKVLIVSATLDACYVATYQQPDPTRWISVARSVKVQEIHKFGDSEQVLPPDDGHGYLWRIFAITRAEQTPTGVIVEQEVVGLSRTIPAALRWLVAPAVERTSRDLIVVSLGQTRSAVLSRLNLDPPCDSIANSTQRPAPKPTLPAAVKSFRQP